MFVKKCVYKLIRFLENNCNLHIFSDKIFLQAEYYSTFKKNINWNKPITFNEKLQWLKVHDRNPIYTTLADKYEVKKYISYKIGKEYLIPMYGIWDSFDDIDFDMLPTSFVLKCTHDSGGIYICQNKESFNYLLCKEVIESSLAKNFFYVGREWPYNNIKPRIMAEAVISDGRETKGLTDYKVHCFNGEPKLILVCKDRFEETGIQESFFDTEWNILNLKRPGTQQCYPKPEKPFLLENMLSISKKLSEGFPFVRVDLYINNNQIYFGELTFYPASGFVPFEPDSFDYLLGKWLDLSTV